MTLNVLLQIFFFKPVEKMQKIANLNLSHDTVTWPGAKGAKFDVLFGCGVSVSSQLWVSVSSCHPPCCKHTLKKKKSSECVPLRCDAAAV